MFTVGGQKKVREEVKFIRYAMKYILIKVKIFFLVLKTLL